MMLYDVGGLVGMMDYRHKWARLLSNIITRLTVKLCLVPIVTLHPLLFTYYPLYIQVKRYVQAEKKARDDHVSRCFFFFYTE